MSRYDLDSAEHTAWADAQARDLLAFYVASRVPGGGFAALDDAGRPQGDSGPLYLTCRMTYCYTLGALVGFDGAPALVRHGLDALRRTYHDDGGRGWFGEARPGRGDEVPADGTKATYAHAFVLLAAATALHAGFNATDVLEEVVALLDSRLWEEQAGLCTESWDRAWTVTEDYRGLNANMHMVEAMLAASTATGDDRFRDRASRVAQRMVAFAESDDWRIPEHFTSSWEPLPDYNREHPADPFRPFGVTPGHGLEWARLLVQLARAGAPSADGLVAAAVGLFERAVADAWEPARHGFAYTTDFDGRPVVEARLHWPLAEGIGAARALAVVTGEHRFAERYAEFWRLADESFIDHERGSWHHELDIDGRVATTVWSGKADQYHALQAALGERDRTGAGLLACLTRS